MYYTKAFRKGTEKSFDQDNWPLGREFNQGMPRDKDRELTARPLCWVLSITTNELTSSGTYVIIRVEEEFAGGKIETNEMGRVCGAYGGG